MSCSASSAHPFDTSASFIANLIRGPFGSLCGANTANGLANVFAIGRRQTPNGCALECQNTAIAHRVHRVWELDQDDCVWAARGTANSRQVDSQIFRCLPSLHSRKLALSHLHHVFVAVSVLSSCAPLIQATFSTTRVLSRTESDLYSSPPRLHTTPAILLCLWGHVLSRPARLLM